jgi:hypothetical protein
MRASLTVSISARDVSGSLVKCLRAPSSAEGTRHLLAPMALELLIIARQGIMEGWRSAALER